MAHETGFSSGMSGVRIISATRRALLLVLVLSVTLISLGHRHIVTAEPVDAATAAFLASGGQLSDLCDIPGEQEGTGTAHCPACLIGQDMALPERAVTSCAAPVARQTVSWPDQDTSTQTIAFDFSRTTRAPPVL